MSLKPTPDREIKIDPRSGIYHYRGTPVRGMKEITRSLKVKNFRTAVQAKREFLWGLRGVDPSAKDILFKDYVKNIFLPERKKKASRTFEMAFYCCKRMMPFFELYSMRQINDHVWDEYVEYQASAHPGTLNGYDRRHLFMMLKRLHKKGIVREMPELRLKDAETKRRRALTRPEIDAIFANSTGTLSGLVLFMYHMGSRPGEILGAKWSEFNLSKGIWDIPAERTKTRKARSIKINPKVLHWLMDRATGADSVFVFPTRENNKKPIFRYNKQWGHMLEKAGLSKELSPYYLRHTFLTECGKRVRDGALSVAVVAKYAGTSIGEFERTYLHIEGEDTKEVSTVMDIGSGE